MAKKGPSGPTDCKYAVPNMCCFLNLEKPYPKEPVAPILEILSASFPVD